MKSSNFVQITRLEKIILDFVLKFHKIAGYRFESFRVPSYIKTVRRLDLVFYEHAQIEKLRLLPR